MTENATPPWWGEQWMEANRRSWDAWAGAFRGAADAAAPRAASGPTAGLDWWWRLMRGPGPAFASVPDPLDRVIEQGKMFLRFGEEFTAGVLAGNGVQNADAWAQAFKTFTDNWQAAFAQQQADPAVAQLWKSASAPWGEMAAGLQAQAERLLGLPGLGYTRESQEQWQEMARLTLVYQEALQAYAAAFRPLAPAALERLQRRLAECAERREPVNTLRGLYDLWVDASEEAYLELVSTDAYSQVHGRMTNAFMALKHQARHMMDDAVGSMGLPTRAGVDTLQRRQQELRREVASLRAGAGDTAALQKEVASLRAGAADAAALRKELAELRREVQAIRSQQASAEAPPSRRAAKTIRRKSEET